MWQAQVHPDNPYKVNSTAVRLISVRATETKSTCVVTVWPPAESILEADAKESYTVATFQAKPPSKKRKILKGATWGDDDEEKAETVNLDLQLQKGTSILATGPITIQGTYLKQIAKKRKMLPDFVANSPLSRPFPGHNKIGGKPEFPPFKDFADEINSKAQAKKQKKEEIKEDVSPRSVPMAFGGNNRDLKKEALRSKEKEKENLRLDLVRSLDVEEDTEEMPTVVNKSRNKKEIKKSPMKKAMKSKPEVPIDEEAYIEKLKEAIEEKGRLTLRTLGKVPRHRAFRGNMADFFIKHSRYFVYDSNHQTVEINKRKWRQKWPYKQQPKKVKKNDKNAKKKIIEKQPMKKQEETAQDRIRRLKAKTKSIMLK